MSEIDVNRDFSRKFDKAETGIVNSLACYSILLNPKTFQILKGIKLFIFVHNAIFTKFTYLFLKRCLFFEVKNKIGTSNFFIDTVQEKIIITGEKNC